MPECCVLCGSVAEAVAVCVCLCVCVPVSVSVPVAVPVAVWLWLWLCASAPSQALTCVVSGPAWPPDRGTRVSDG